MLGGSGRLLTMMHQGTRSRLTFPLLAALLTAAAVLLALVVGVQARPAAVERPPLLFKAGAIDTTRPPANRALSTTAASEALYLIQFNGVLRDEWLAAVRATGALPLHYVAQNGYVVWADEAARARLRTMVAQGDILGYGAPYSASLKMAAEMEAASSAEAGVVEVTVQMLRHPGDEPSKRIIEALALDEEGPWENVLHYQNLQVSLPRQALAQVAALPDVIWIEPQSEPQRFDERQAQILAAHWNTQQTGPAGPGYVQWLREKGFSENPLDYPIVDITDDGIGNGDAAAAAGDQTFRVDGNINGASRLAYLHDCTKEGDPGGPDGHGHLNANIVGGMSQRSGAPHEDEAGYQRGLGINPFGRLAGTRVFNNDGPGLFDFSSCDLSYVELVRQSYDAGARIVTNSWGCSGCGYDRAAQDYDAAVRDADPSTPGNQELLILFSAGNAGAPSADSPLGTVGSPANTKNGIAVGASENVRPGWVDGCGFGSLDADNLQEIAFYSSRGPVDGGRIKPDFIAPGTHITGTASTHLFYDGSAICSPYFPLGQQTYAASTGTSHSVPAVAGIASLATYWLENVHQIVAPSPALLKAFLAANTNYLIGSGANDNLPSNSQGFGMPDMEAMFSDRARIVVEQAQPPQFNESGQIWTQTVAWDDASLPLRVVLAFTDQPGFLPTGDAHINNLDLEVRVGGKVYSGNVMSGQWSVTGGTADAANNMEAVFLPPQGTGTVEITVRASLIGGDGVPGNNDLTDQDFALVCDNCRQPDKFEPTDFTFLPFSGA
ncbi:MAG: S8 family serine peptidase [Candidatus Promineifilaceae bacterium]